MLFIHLPTQPGFPSLLKISDGYPSASLYQGMDPSEWACGDPFI